MYFNTNIKILRQRKNRTQDIVANELGVTRSTLNSYENGSIKNPTLDMLIGFSKYFKFATGMTFSNMVKKLRVAQARRLLDSTDYPITQVALQSGYKNMANFNRQFLSEVGTTPTKYRRLESSQKPPSEVLSLGLRAPDEP